MRTSAARLVAAVLLLAPACGSSVADSGAVQITGEQLAERIEAGTAPFVLDVRSRDEFAGGSVPGAVNIPYDELPERLAELPVAPGDEVVVYCHSGRRAQIAANALREGGFSNVRDLAGHWSDWRADRRPAR